MSAFDGRAFGLPEGLDPDATIGATYLLQGPADEDALGRALSAAMEQTIGRACYEIAGFEDLIPAHGGRLLSYFRVPAHETRASLRQPEWTQAVARVAFPSANAGGQLPMLLTMVLGDLSLGGLIKLVDLDLPASFLRGFAGPKFGLEGVRRLVGSDRPLICSILKPCVGLSPERAAELFRQHALGGAEVIKDDELMAYDEQLRIEDRVRACRRAAEQAFEQTGQRVLYLTSITDRPDRMHDKARRAIEAGANGLMLTPLSTGLGALEMLAEDPDLNVPLFAHPALLGAMSWSPDVGIGGAILIAKLVRLAGADINALPVPYGRFTHLRESYIRMLKLSQAPMRHIKPCFTQVGGGLHALAVPDVIRDVGRDVMLVIGGSAQRHPGGLTAGVRAVHQAISVALEGRTIEQAAGEYPELRQAQAAYGGPKG